MKKIALMLTTALVLFTFSCKKDDEVTFEKSSLIGTWTKVKPVSEDGTVEKLKFTNDSVFSISGSDFSMSIGTKYTFDGKTIKYNMILDISMSISSLSSSKFTGTQTSSFGALGSDSEDFEYKK